MQEQNSTTVWNKLLEAELVKGDKPIIEAQSPWYIKLLLSISGWFGALFLMIFVGGSLGLMLNRNIEDFPLLLTIVGSGLIFFSYSMFKKKQSDFLEHFFLAFSVTGQALVIASIFFMLHERMNTPVLLFITLFQAFLMWVIPNYIHRMLSSFFMASAVVALFFNLGEPFVPVVFLTFVVAWLWMREFKLGNHQRIEAIAYGQTAALVWMKYTFMATPYYLYELIDREKTLFFSPWMVELGSFLTLLYVVWQILDNSKKVNDKTVLLLSLVAVALLGLLSMEIHGLIVGVIFLLIGFAHSHRLLMGLGVFVSLSFLSHYYYFKGETLLDKAGLLALLGLGLLLSHFVMKFFLKKEAKDV